DEAALIEVDAAQLVHVALMRKGIAVGEVEAAARHPERDAMSLVGRRVDELGAQVGCRLAGKVRRQHAAQAQGRKPRTLVAQTIFGGGIAVPDREHTEYIGQVLDYDLGPELVEVEPLQHRRRKRARAIQEEPAAVGSWRLHQDEIDNDLTLRSKQRGKAGG